MKKQNRAAGEDLDLYISGVCENACLFCSYRDRVVPGAPRFMPFADIIRLLREKSKSGSARLSLTGGEPALHPKLPEILYWARRMGYAVSLSTEGTAFADPAFARAVAPLLSGVTVSVHGAAAALVDRLAARKGRFALLARALANLRAFAPSLRIVCNSVLCRANYRQMPAIIRWTQKLCRPQMHSFSNPVPMGYSDARYKAVVAPLPALARAVPAAVKAAGKAGVRLRFFGLPACALGRFWKYSEDHKWTSRTEVALEPPAAGGGYEEFERRTAHSTRVHAKACAGCAFRGWCPGVYGKYLELCGERELKPVRRPPKPSGPAEEPRG